MKADLLNDVIHEGDYADFRAMLGEAVAKEAARKRSRRQAAWVAVAASVALLFALNIPRAPRREIREAQKPPWVIHTVALGKDQILHTSSSARSITIVSNGSVPKINDAQLLEMFSDHATALIAISGKKQLVFFEEADTRHFMGSN
jgi:hypothetical protein